MRTFFLSVLSLMMVLATVQESKAQRADIPIYDSVHRAGTTTVHDPVWHGRDPWYQSALGDEFSTILPAQNLSWRVTQIDVPIHVSREGSYGGPSGNDDTERLMGSSDPTNNWYIPGGTMWYFPWEKRPPNKQDVTCRVSVYGTVDTTITSTGYAMSNLIHSEEFFVGQTAIHYGITWSIPSQNTPDPRTFMEIHDLRSPFLMNQYMTDVDPTFDPTRDTFKFKFRQPFFIGDGQNLGIKIEWLIDGQYDKWIDWQTGQIATGNPAVGSSPNGLFWDWDTYQFNGPPYLGGTNSGSDGSFNAGWIVGSIYPEWTGHITQGSTQKDLQFRLIGTER